MNVPASYKANVIDILVIRFVARFDEIWTMMKQDGVGFGSSRTYNPGISFGLAHLICS